MNKIVALIPARGGSKKIPLKNIKEFCGYPLIYWVVKAACESSMISEVYVATDSDQIKNTVEKFDFDKLNLISRSEETATDTASTEMLMLEFTRSHQFDLLVLIQATSPLLNADDIDSGIRKLSAGGFDSLLSVVRQKRFIWHEQGKTASPINYNPVLRPMRQQWDGYLVENGAFYITKRINLLESSCRVSGKIGLFEMCEDSYFELDEPEDWTIMETLKNQGQSRMSIDFNNIKLFICDVDGVLTDGGMYYSSLGETMKKFNAVDGHGLSLLKSEGIKVMFLTREKSKIVEERARKLNIDFVETGIYDKHTFLEEFFKNNEIYKYSNIAYVGDDINDTKPIQLSYFSAVPSDGNSLLKRFAKYICNKDGGKGCVREVCDLILSRRNII